MIGGGWADYRITTLDFPEYWHSDFFSVSSLVPSFDISVVSLVKFGMGTLGGGRSFLVTTRGFLASEEVDVLEDGLEEEADDEDADEAICKKNQSQYKVDVTFTWVWRETERVWLGLTVQAFSQKS